MLTFRNPVLLIACLALLATACKKASPVEITAPQEDLWRLCEMPSIGAPVTSIVSGRNGKLFALLGGDHYAGGDVVRSTDSGSTWSALTKWAGFINLIADKKGNLYAGQNGVWRSTDDGKSWSPLGGGEAGAPVNELTMIANEWIFMVSGNNCYRSTDAGQTWERTSTTSFQSIDVLYDEKTNTIYLRTDSHGANVKLWKSTDDGTTWSFVRQFYSSTIFPDFRMAVDSIGRLWFIDQDGTVFLNSSQVGQSSFGRPLVLEIDLSGSLLLGVNGFHFSSDGGVSWVTNSTGLTDTVITAIGIQPGGIIFVGTVSGKIFRSTRAVTK